MSSDRKHQIIAESLRLFGRHGYDKVTVKQLADACGITEPALYRHFASKEAIYNAVLDSLKSFQNYAELFTRLERETDLRVILKELAGHIWTFFTAHREIYRLLLYSTLGEHDRAREVFRDIRGPYVQFLTAQLDRLYAAGRIKQRNNEITARCFVGMVFDCALSATMWRGFLGKTYKPEEVMANNVPIFADGLLV